MTEGVGNEVPPVVLSGRLQCRAQSAETLQEREDPHTPCTVQTASNCPPVQNNQSTITPGRDSNSAWWQDLDSQPYRLNGKYYDTLSTMN